MIYSDILYISRRENYYEVGVYFPQKPLAGQFVSLIIPGEREIPLSISDYYDKVLTLHISEKLYERIKGKKRILLKGPLGRPLNLICKSVLGIGYKELFLDILYILKEARRKGLNVKVKCIECSTNEFEESYDEKADLIIASVPPDLISSLPRDTYVYVRWVKMSCMVGVCGICEVNGKLPCIEGPLLKVSEIVDKGKRMDK